MRYPILIVSVWLLAAGCLDTGVDDGTEEQKPDVRFLDQAMTPAEIANVKQGDPAYAMVEREEGLRFVPITLGLPYTSGSTEFFTFVDGDAKFGFGDSGSPILSVQGKTIGALSGSFGGDNVLITPITAMLASVDRAAPLAPANVRAASRISGVLQNKLAWFSKGIGAAGRDKLRKAGIPLTDFDTGPALAAYAKSAAAPANFAQTIEAGRSLAVVMLDGPIVSLFAVGTATHKVGKNEMVAFGHPMNWDGKPKFNLPVSPAKVVQFVRDPVFGSFKLAVPDGDVVGGIIDDRSTGILLSDKPSIENVALTLTAGGTTTTHRVCRLIDSELQFFLVAQGLDSIVQGQLDIGVPGPQLTSVRVTYTDKDPYSTEMDVVDWTYEGSWAVWDLVADDFETVQSIEITLTEPVP